MANNVHTIINTTSCACENIDALNHAGVYSAGDLDNGTLVTLVKMNVGATDGDIKGYEYEVKPADAGADNVFVVASPEVGYTLESQTYEDPRYFYNKAGEAMSIKGLIGGVDCIQITAPAFVGGALPAANTVGQFVAPAAGGKYAAPVSDAPASGAYFRVEGFTPITVGWEEVPSVVLRCMANHH